MGIISERLKELRDSKKITQSEIADSVGLSRATYAMYEIGKSKPKPETLQKIADFYSVTVDYLLGSDMDKVDLIIQKVKELTDSNKLEWETYQDYFAFSNPEDYQNLSAILEHYNEKADDSTFVAIWKGMHYIILKNKQEHTFIAARCDIISGLIDLVSGIKISSNERNLTPLLQSVYSVRNKANDDFYNSILDNLDNLDTNKPDKT